MSGHLPEVSLLEAALDESEHFSVHPQVVTHLSACANCQRRLVELREDLTSIVSHDAVTPPPALRERILAVHKERPPQPFAGLVRRASRLFDLDAVQIEKLFHDAISDAAWEINGPLSDFHFAPGKTHPAGTDGGIIRLEPGASTPRHRHLGDEYTLVLDGCLRDDDSGKEALPGDLLHMPKDSAHTVTCASPTPCLFAVLLHGGASRLEPL